MIKQFIRTNKQNITDALKIALFAITFIISVTFLIFFIYQTFRNYKAYFLLGAIATGISTIYILCEFKEDFFISI